METFTAKFLENIPHPCRGQKIYIDEMPPFAAVTGLFGKMVGRNTKTFFVQYRYEGKRKQLRLEQFPGPSLIDSRKLAAVMLAIVDRSINPKVDIK